MEVHHHPHVENLPAGQAGKKFKEYFLVFLMIFLAVSMGFFAESLRERTSDNHKEKEYIHLLIADLKNDQEVLSEHIANVNAGILMMDTLIDLLNNHSQIADNTGRIYYLARLAPRLTPLLVNTRTFEQLKNSGNFRLIKDLASSDKIKAYYEKLSMVHLLESVNETEFTEFKKIVSRVFDPAVFLKMEGVDGKIMRTNENPSLRTTDPELLQELSVFAVYMHGTKRGITGTAQSIKIPEKNYWSTCKRNIT